MVDIKECPFCGGYALIERKTGGYASESLGKKGYRCKDIFYVKCVDCGATGKKVESDYDMTDDLTNEELEKALKAWNNRN